MKGKLFVIEGSDASGKATQTKLLYERLLKDGFKVKKIEFPNYKSDSSTLVKMYLNGEFGDDPGDVNPYAASTFYAVDRFVTYKKDWEDFYLQDGIVIADRYTTSNMIYQAAKFKNERDKEKFLDWLWELEFDLYELPPPDKVFFLDLPPEYSFKLLEERKREEASEKDHYKDIHELNYKYMVQSYKNACYVADKYNWEKIYCLTDGGSVRGVGELNEKIYKRVTESLSQGAE